MPRAIELLAPAKDLDTARAAIQHGADAVYIGAPRFGARASAGVSLEDLSTLCRQAHFYGVRIYVTLNTIIYDHELAEVEQLIWDIYRAGADAIIIQDMGITKMDLPPIPLHSSTQCDTTEPEDAVLLEAMGFEQIVLARELNIEQIRRIKSVTTKPLEVFIHGALCVSYSGRCYLSQALTKRSANRGECSQQCRLPYNLRDSRGELIRKEEHLLSPRDLNRTDLLEELLDAGASSLKIEGRLKSVSYVKNITAHYRQRLDTLIARYPDRYCRASYGRTSFAFEPNPAKSFNRGFTDFQFHIPSSGAPKSSVVNLHSSKSQGEYLGIIGASSKQSWQILTDKALANGDGLLYITPEGRVGGINVNRSMGAGVIHPARPEVVPVGSRVYRNYDQEFERMLSAPTATRRIAVAVRLSSDVDGLIYSIRMLGGHHNIEVTTKLPMELEPAKRFDRNRLQSEISKLGDTILLAEEAEIDFGANEYFIPLSLLGGLRREAVGAFLDRLESAAQPQRSPATERMPLIPRAKLPRRRKQFVVDYSANVSNHLARAHYRELGYGDAEDAFELKEVDTAELMCTKHCIRHELGYCTRETKQPLPYKEPLYLEQSGNRLRLEFDCTRCQMLLFKG